MKMGSQSSRSPTGAATREAYPDGAITRARTELKFLLSAEQVQQLVSVLDRRLQPHHYSGEDSSPLPFAQHFITTLYLDTASRTHYRAAQADRERSVKVRLREYYDVHPSLAELATTPEQILHHSAHIWLEVKRREGNHTNKRRVRLLKRDVPKLFSVAGGAQAQAIALDSTTSSEAGQTLQDIAEFCRSFEEPLRPDCLANYERLSWQDPAHTLRLTLDLGLAFFAPAADLWETERVLSRDVLGPVRGGISSGVLEVKYLGQLPAWLQQELDAVGLKSQRHSKFLGASQAVHGS